MIKTEHRNLKKVESMSMNPISWIRDSEGFKKITTALTVSFFLFTFYSPSALAIKQAAEKPSHPSQHIEGDTDEEKLSNTLQAIKERVAERKSGLAQRVQQESNLWQDFLNLFGGSDLAAEDMDELLELYGQAHELHQSALRNFDEIERDLKQKKLPAEILQRHHDAVAKYKAEYQRFQNHLQRCREAESLQDQREAMEELDVFLQGQQFKRSQQPFDPNNLPNKYLQPSEKYVPNLEGHKYLGSEPKTVLEGLTDSLVSGLVGEVHAASDSFVFDALPGATDSALLGETSEIVFSDAIKNKAAELNHDPVKIYHWVRNNIDWQPSWGSTQTSELTLSTKNGNAIDTASLLISLLRVSGIPARYVRGVIEVPVDEFKNWAGGFSNINAAFQFASSSGIPVTSVVSGGQIRKVQIEHVWVEAAIDYFPSRGAKNRAADSWIAMDPSFKQYEYIQGIDTSEIITIEPDEIIDTLLASGTINEQEGWVEGLDKSIIENAQEDIEQTLSAYIEDNLPEAAPIDVMGGRRVILQDFPSLPSSLPYRTISAGQRYSEIPDSLQQKITFAFGEDILGGLNSPTTFPWASLNNEKITLSFKPATEADEQTLLSYLPEGEITDINQLPTSFPAYLVNVVPELKLKGEVIKSGNTMKLGEELAFFFNPTILGQGTMPNRYDVIAGSYLNIAVISGRVSTDKLQQLQQAIEATRNIIIGQNENLLAGITRETLLGDMFYAGLMAYYSQYTSLARIVGLKQAAHHYLSAGLGSFGYEPEVDTFFGFPRAIKGGGIGLNIPIIQATSVDNNNQESYKNYNLQIGTLSSALEHAVPEQMFVDEQNPGEAMSGIKAIHKAMDAGQKIYHITPANQGITLPNIRHDNVTMSEIRQALNGGKEIFTHSNAVAIPGWSGAGYIIFDPETGSGAYKITGGANGAILVAVIGIGLFLASALGIALTPLFVILLTLVVVMLNIVSILEQLNCGGAAPAIFITLAFSLLAFLLPAKKDVARLLRAALASFIARSGLTAGLEAACVVQQL